MWKYYNLCDFWIGYLIILSFCFFFCVKEIIWFFFFDNVVVNRVCENVLKNVNCYVYYCIYYFESYFYYYYKNGDKGLLLEVIVK